jgi:hypothetical protein
MFVVPNWDKIKKNPVVTNVEKKPDAPVKDADGKMRLNGQELIEFSMGALYNPKDLRFYRPDGVALDGTFHSVTSRRDSSDTGSSDDLQDPRAFPTDKTVADIVAWLRSKFPALAFQVRKFVPYPGPVPITGSGSEGTTEIIGLVEIAAASPLADTVVSIDPRAVWTARVGSGDAMAVASLLPSLRASGLVI